LPGGWVVPVKIARDCGVSWAAIDPDHDVN
jgi:hypothetical protein